MNDELSLNSVKWAAKLEHVREVSLTGTADIEFWTKRSTVPSRLPLCADKMDTSVRRCARQVEDLLETLTPSRNVRADGLSRTRKRALFRLH